ncbi:hypothetical protein MLD38_035746 [Melastoma candidum]|uniref:Uncharacterized protein n=1 Tax=Melastoma candidum TaxID=119954 RepID=A0ACB9LHK0_9MYRT|nr:hypothetical protein MLD38_035746 [Melastoma candidum]
MVMTNEQVGMLNVYGYYNSLLSARHIILSVPTAHELLSKLEEYIWPPPDKPQKTNTQSNTQFPHQTTLSSYNATIPKRTSHIGKNRVLVELDDSDAEIRWKEAVAGVEDSKLAVWCRAWSKIVDARCRERCQEAGAGSWRSGGVTADLEPGKRHRVCGQCHHPWEQTLDQLPLFGIASDQEENDGARMDETG